MSRTLIPMSVACCGLLAFAAVVGRCSDHAATMPSTQPDAMAPVFAVVQSLGADVGSLTPRQQDALAEGLYLIYGSKRTQENLTRLMDTLGGIVASPRASEQIGQRCAVLACQFGVLDRKQFQRVVGPLWDSNVLFRLAYADSLGRAGQVHDALERLMADTTLPVEFSLAQADGLRSLLTEMVVRGQDKGASAVAIFTASGRCLGMDAAYCDDLIRGVQRLYRRRGVSKEHTTHLLRIQLAIARSLLMQRASVAHGAIGNALLQDLRIEVDLRTNRGSKERDELIDACDALDGDVELMKKANVLLAGRPRRISARRL